MVERVDDNENLLSEAKSLDEISDVDVEESAGGPQAKPRRRSSRPLLKLSPPSSGLVTSPSLPAHLANADNLTVPSSHHDDHKKSKSECDNFNGNSSDKYLNVAAIGISNRREDGISETQDEKRSWFEGMYPSYKSRNKEYKELFSEEKFKFLVDFSCAHSKDILRQGRMYISTGFVCFYSKIFGYEHALKIPFEEITDVSKEKTAFFIPNAIQIVTKWKKTYFFTTFHNRDSTFDILTKLWGTAKNGDMISEDEICQIIMVQYPEEDVCDGAPSRPTSVTFSLGAPSTLDINLDQNQNATLEPGGEMSEHLKEIVHDWLESVPGNLVLNIVIQKPVGDIQTLLFTNSNFYFTFQKNRGTTELDVGDWESGAGEQGRTREVSYNMKINNPVGPKTSQVKEIQIERTCSSPGQIYCIDLEAFNSGFPYSDAFTVRTHICVHEESNLSCRILVKAEIVFEKELWSYIKGKIESNAWNGLKSYYHDLGVALVQHRDDIKEVADHYGDRKKSRRGNMSKKFVEQPVFGVSGADNSQDSWSKILFAFVIFILLVTCIVNIYVLTHMYLLQPSLDANWQPQRETLADIDVQLLESLPQTDKEWFQIFRAQVLQHHQVRQEISDSLDRITSSLQEAEKVLEHASEVLKKASADNIGTIDSVLKKVVQYKQTAFNKI